MDSIRLALAQINPTTGDIKGNADRIIAYAENAAGLGADAVVNVRFVTTSVIGSAAELLAYGTAVKLAPSST